MKKKFLITFSFIILVCAHAYAQTPQKSAAAQEADKLSREVVKLFKEKEFKEAEPVARRVISVREMDLGKDHISVADAWRNMAYIQLQLENKKDAENAFDRAFEIYEKNQPLSPANEKTFVETLEASAFYDATDRNFDKAEKKFLRANELREKINGKDSLELADNFMRLGQIYRIKEDYEKAASVFFQALEIKREKTAGDRNAIGEVFLETSCAYGKLGRKDELSEIRNEIYPKVADADISNSKSDRPRQITKGVVNGAAVSLPKPAYPLEARQNRASGAVNVQVLIDESGNVLHACAVDGAKELQQASEIAAYGAKFKPTTLSGKPVRVMGVIVYNYVP
jgi:tetratricopeptide (TPR) repeat protein